MAVKIAQKIKSVEVVRPEEERASAAPAIEQMHESLARPEVLVGATYKIKTPTIEHALYVTINDMVLNQGTEHESRRPFEIFINSKNMDQFQWVVALTRIMSAVFRKGGDCTFLVEEMKAVFDPHGGYWKPGGVFMPSLIAEIGSVLERHLKNIGLLPDNTLSEDQKRLIAEKRAAYDARAGQATSGVVTEAGTDAAAFPSNATVCPKCNTKAMIRMDNCDTCLNCGNSKCG